MAQKIYRKLYNINFINSNDKLNIRIIFKLDINKYEDQYLFIIKSIKKKNHHF